VSAEGDVSLGRLNSFFFFYVETILFKNVLKITLSEKSGKPNSILPFLHI